MWRWWGKGFLVRHKSKKFWTPLGKLLVVKTTIYWISTVSKHNKKSSHHFWQIYSTKYTKKPMFQGGHFTMVTCLLNIRAWIQTYFCVTPKPYEKIMQKWLLATVWVQQNPQVSHQMCLILFCLISLLTCHPSTYLSLHLSLWAVMTQDYLCLLTMTRQIPGERFKEQHISPFLLMLLLNLIRQLRICVTVYWKQNYVYHLNISRTHIFHI